MYFNSRNKREIYYKYILLRIPDLLIAGGVSIYFQMGFFGFLLVFLVLETLHLVTWILRKIILTIYFFKFSKNRRSNLFFELFQKNKFPEPDLFLSSPLEYLQSVSDNEKVDVSIRMLASSILGALGALEGSGNFESTVALEDAIERYRNSLTNTPM